MTFDEILAQVTELLQRQGRVSYGALKRRFALDEEYLQDLRDELITAQRIAVDEGGIRQIHQGLDTLRATGSGVGWTTALAMLSEAYGKVEQAEVGLNVLAEALELVTTTGERYYEAELWRLKGELLLQPQARSKQVEDKSRAS